MPISQSEKTINSHVYCVQTFPARRGLKVKAKLGKLLAPFFSVVLSDTEANVDGQWLSQLTQLITDNLNEDAWLDLVEHLISETRVDGVELRHQFDDLFAGNYDTLYQVLRFILEVNYSDFLSKTLGSLTSKAIAT